MAQSTDDELFTVNAKDLTDIIKEVLSEYLKGGPGSGNFGHEGRPRPRPW